MKPKRTAQTATFTEGKPFESLFERRNHDWSFACFYSVFQTNKIKRCLTNSLWRLSQLSFQGHPTHNMLLCYHKNYLDFKTASPEGNSKHASFLTAVVHAIINPEGNSKHAFSSNCYSPRCYYSPVNSTVPPPYSRIGFEIIFWKFGTTYWFGHI
jgi:hypothetical protein